MFNLVIFFSSCCRLDDDDGFSPEISLASLAFYARRSFF